MYGLNFLSPASAGGNRIGPDSVSVLTQAKPFDIWIENLASGCSWTIFRTSSKGKVIGQRSRSLGWKMWFSDNFACLFWFERLDKISWSMMWHHRMMSWCKLTSQNDVIMSKFNVSSAKRLWNICGRCINAGAFSLVWRIAVQSIYVGPLVHCSIDRKLGTLVV